MAADAGSGAARNGVVRLCWLVAGCAAVLCGCTAPGDDQMQEPSVSAALERHSPALIAIPGVVAVGESECDGVPCIKVYVAETTPELRERIPGSLEGFPVVVEESGEIRPLDERR